MIDFIKCGNCGAEAAPGETGCPVCGAAFGEKKSAAGQSVAGGGFAAPKRPEKSAFAPAGDDGLVKPDAFRPAGRDYYRNDSGVAKPPLGGGVIALLTIFTLAGFIISIIAAGIAALLFVLGNIGWHRSGQEERLLELLIVLCGFSFVTASCFAGSATGYNLGVYICLRTRMVNRELTIVSVRAMIGAYFAAFMSAAVFTIIGSVLGLNYATLEFIVFLNVAAAIPFCVYVMRRIAKAEKEVL
jgi:hypothetical protein